MAILKPSLKKIVKSLLGIKQDHKIKDSDLISVFQKKYKKNSRFSKLSKDELATYSKVLKVKSRKYSKTLLLKAVSDLVSKEVKKVGGSTDVLPFEDLVAKLKWRSNVNINNGALQQPAQTIQDFLIEKNVTNKILSPELENIFTLDFAYLKEIYDRKNVSATNKRFFEMAVCSQEIFFTVKEHEDIFIDVLGKALTFLNEYEIDINTLSIDVLVKICDALIGELEKQLRSISAQGETVRLAIDSMQFIISQLLCNLGLATMRVMYADEIAADPKVYNASYLLRSFFVFVAEQEDQKQQLQTTYQTGGGKGAFFNIFASCFGLGSTPVTPYEGERVPPIIISTKKTISGWLQADCSRYLNPMNLILQRSEGLCLYIAYLTAIFTSHAIRPKIEAFLQKPTNTKKEQFKKIIRSLFDNAYVQDTMKKITKALNELQTLLETKLQLPQKLSIESESELILNNFIERIQFSTTTFMQQLHEYDSKFIMPSENIGNTLIGYDFIKCLLEEMDLKVFYMFMDNKYYAFNEAVSSQFKSLTPKDADKVVIIFTRPTTAFALRNNSNERRFPEFVPRREDAIIKSAWDKKYKDYQKIGDMYERQYQSTTFTVTPFDSTNSYIVHMSGLVLSSYVDTSIGSGMSIKYDLSRKLRIKDMNKIPENLFRKEMYEQYCYDRSFTDTGHAISGYSLFQNTNENSGEGKLVQYIYNGHGSHLLNLPCSPFHTDSKNIWFEFAPTKNEPNDTPSMLYDITDTCTFVNDSIANDRDKADPTTIKDKIINSTWNDKDTIKKEYTQRYLRYRVDFNSMTVGIGSILTQIEIDKKEMGGVFDVSETDELKYVSSYHLQKNRTPYEPSLVDELDKIKNLITELESSNKAQAPSVLEKYIKILFPKLAERNTKSVQSNPQSNALSQGTNKTFTLLDVPKDFVGGNLISELKKIQNNSSKQQVYETYIHNVVEETDKSKVYTLNVGNLKLSLDGVDKMFNDLMNNNIFLFIKDTNSFVDGKILYVRGVYEIGAESVFPIVSHVNKLIKTMIDAFEIGQSRRDKDEQGKPLSKMFAGKGMSTFNDMVSSLQSQIVDILTKFYSIKQLYNGKPNVMGAIASHLTKFTILSYVKNIFQPETNLMLVRKEILMLIAKVTAVHFMYFMSLNVSESEVATKFFNIDDYPGELLPLPKSAFDPFHEKTEPDNKPTSRAITIWDLSNIQVRNIIQRLYDNKPNITLKGGAIFIKTSKKVSIKGKNYCIYLKKRTQYIKHHGAFVRLSEILKQVGKK